MIDFSKPRFQLGRIVATPGALEAIEAAKQAPSDFLDRHVRGDWGDVCADDQEANEQALINGSRLLSSYKTSLDVKLWVITEAADDKRQRSATTIMLPDEY